jgi:predicted metal-dependent hydrolase
MIDKSFNNMAFSEINNPIPIAITIARQQVDIPVWMEERKRLSIRVQPDQSITARAPLAYSYEEIQSKLQKRAGWIEQQLDYFEPYQPIQPERQYISGETHYYLGRQYRLKVSEGSQESVKLIGQFFQVATPDAQNHERVKGLMQVWTRQHAITLIQRRAALYLERVQRSGAKEPVFQFRRMEKRWGSCTPKGVITFNTELVKAPIHCIDYVVLHELCHLVEEGHTPRFYRLLERLMPDWKKRKERLEKVVLV